MADAFLAEMWGFLREQWWLQHESFEPLLASFCFALWMRQWKFIDTRCSFLWRYRISQSKSDGILENNSTKGTVTADRSDDEADLRSWEMDHWFSKARWMTAIGYLLPLLVYDALFPRRLQLLRAHWTAPTCWTLVRDLTLSVWLYDFLFYWIHLAFHKLPYVYRFHAVHHAPHAVRAGDTLRLGFVDGALQVACNILALRLLACHPLSRALHNVVVTYMLAEIHSGYDIPWLMTHRWVPFGILAGPRAHQRHHETGKHSYHQFFCYLDKPLKRYL